MTDMFWQTAKTDLINDYLISKLCDTLFIR